MTVINLTLRQKEISKIVHNSIKKFYVICYILQLWTKILHNGEFQNKFNLGSGHLSAVQALTLSSL